MIADLAARMTEEQLFIIQAGLFALVVGILIIVLVVMIRALWRSW